MDLQLIDYIRAFALTTLAGLSTGIGGLVIFRKKPLNQHIVSASLGLSAGVMLYIAFVEMLGGSYITLSEIYGNRGNLYTVLSFFGGIFFIMIIDFLVPEAQNPHELHSVTDISYDPHLHEKPAKAKLSVVKREEVREKSNLTRVGLLSAIGIAAHNMPEGIAAFVAALADPALGVSIAIAIAIHNIPEGIAIAVPLYAGTGDKKKSFLTALLSGLAEPFGALIGFLILRPYISETLLAVVFAFAAGIMVYISLDELLPTAEKQGEHHLVIGGVIVGMLIMALTLLVL